MRVWNRAFIAAALIPAAVLAAGCATSRGVSTPAQPVSVEPVGVRKLVLMTPFLELVDSDTGVVSPWSDAESAPVQATLSSALRSELGNKSFGRAGVGEFSANASKLGDVARMYQDLRAGVAADRHLQNLREWNADVGASHLLFCRYRIYVGPGGFWDPISGMIRSDSSRSVLECTLLDLAAERIVWKKAVQSRTPRGSAEAALAELVPNLVSGL